MAFQVSCRVPIALDAFKGQLAADDGHGQAGSRNGGGAHIIHIIEVLVLIGRSKPANLIRNYSGG